VGRRDRLSISFELNEICDAEVRRSIEAVIRACVGDRLEAEHWTASIEGGSDYYDVTVSGPQPTRRKRFFGDPQSLPEQIRNWLQLYPFR
jgi:hypothetical protein